MSQSRPTPSRVETAFELVQKQRRIVDTTKIGSPAHRQASEVLALIEESHFLLSELERTTAATPTKIKPAATTPQASGAPASTRRRRFSLELALAFAAALVAGAFFLEMADPAPMNIQASELGGVPTQP